jgi:ribonuclease Z
MLGVTILGNNSAIPAYGRHPTAQIITTQDDLLLFDCGEGTQIQIMNYKIRRSRINHIFISHLHGDHYYGLVGLLSSFALLGRIQPLHVYGPAALKELLELQFRLSETLIPFPYFFHPIEKDGLLLDAPNYTVSCFSTKHRIECRGFIIQMKKKLRKDPGSKPKSYAFTADTLFDPDLIPHIQGVDLLYHEATYPHAFVDKASSRFHSTTKEAAEIARRAGVKKLLIGHFSAKFEDTAAFEAEARTVFTNTEAAAEGTTYLV